MTRKEDQTQSIALTSATDLRDKIYTIRGVKVMLDRDLAEIYGYNLSAFNQQVKNNLDRFDENFRFQLTRNEFEELLKSKFLISNNINIIGLNNQTSMYTRGGNRRLPHVFTEQGIYMLMTVLKGDLAVKQSKALIILFKQMKDMLISESPIETNRYLLRLNERVESVESQVDNLKMQVVTKSELQDFMVNFTEEHLGRELLMLDGHTLEASAAYQQIFATAQVSIYLIDNYVSLQKLLQLKDVNPKVTITIFSDNSGKNLTKRDGETFVREYPKVQLTFKRTHGKIHDRFIILDYATANEKVYHCGGSLKDAGRKTTMIMQVEKTALLHPLIEELLLQ